ncbi:lysophospholipid acyltransferase family protein [Algisphaera agarilytica]|uniref:1-acyl-sn-glycerol-3-phosphate acyltransferase n=1 Tax=Algisphaera agarilytica TaxID=1385975 RepID=A0A7X0H8R1_9BACT|nr:lysophospholipid acyltransferase family protein [Algisphaera agarilytica]MBB6431333.1 1-acyl-sn-glycerol-3-phosphate acyltransferase [Algisphaera agarilytica]
MTWFRDLRKRQPNRPLWRIAIWQFMQSMSWLYLLVLYRTRSWGVRNIPDEGPVLLLSNHQSFYDPILIGFGCSKRHFYSLARHTLFTTPIAKLFQRVSNAIPVEQGAGDTKAIKKCIEVLKDDQTLMLFPEGARTMTGDVEKFETGAMLIIKRAKPTVVPVALEGVYDVWPRGQSKPKWSGRLGVMFGEPIPAEELLAMKADAAMDMVRDRVDAMRSEIAERIGKK